MARDLAQLSDDQSVRVLVEFFELLPAASRPGYDELALVVDDLRDGASGELRSALGRIDDPALRGALARQVLQLLAAEPALQAPLDEAVDRAGRAHMVALPELVAGVIVVLAVLPSHFERDAKGKLIVQWNQLQNLANLLKPVGGIVKALPKGLLERLG